MMHVDESFEGSCVVKQEDGRLWSYGEGDDAAMENPIAAWFLVALGGGSCGRILLRT